MFWGIFLKMRTAVTRCTTSMSKIKSGSLPYLANLIVTWNIKSKVLKCLSTRFPFSVKSNAGVGLPFWIIDHLSLKARPEKGDAIQLAMMSLSSVVLRSHFALTDLS